MITRRILGAGLCSCLLTMSLIAEKPNKGAPPVTPDVKAVSAGENAFACDLYAQLRGQAGNIFYSPASLSTALAMCYAGAGGDTAQEMAKTLHYTLPPERLSAAFAGLTRTLNETGGLYKLNVANALWTQAGFPLKPSFLDVMKRDYAAGEHAVDFMKNTEGARQTINQWVEAQTQDKIKNLIPQGSLTPDARLVLTNAIYFKADWLTPFKKEGTFADDFETAPGKKMKAEMMHAMRFAAYAEDRTAKLLELPYKGNDLSMVFVLPSKRHDLASVEKQLTAESLDAWFGRLANARVSIALPKLKMDTGYQMAQTLAKMGMPKAFEANAADFRGIADVPGQPLYISQVIHKAFVAIDEKGTEAAAATAVTMLAGAAADPEQPKEFIADQPFLFLIRDRRTGAILFLGRCAEPTKASEPSR